MQILLNNRRINAENYEKSIPFNTNTIKSVVDV